MLRRIRDLVAGRRRPARLRVEPAGVTVPVVPGATILEAALAAGVAFPHGCRDGACGACACRMVAGRARQRDDKGRGQRRAAGAILLACRSVPRGDVVVEVRTGRGGDGVSRTSPRR
jgi:ferredoxin